ncbi:MAG: restriction endonuclease subunit S [Nitrospirae bacterium]|nr:restriction endonuclease subunit S [Magnetococcales bacterium]HAT50416.1 restriction endonuclease subunit S [Alphaproteobacteria bacterium]
MSGRPLKTDWRMVKFGEMTDNINVRVDPAEAGSDIYVGLEHLDPESLHLRQWGQPSDVTGDKLRFQKGDIIFARRRAYQRKLAVAEFDGICSAHAMVVRGKPKVVLPEFLPFFMQSDMFMERAIEISVGSLSPTINWKTMAVQEFPLPPIEEQHRIAEILWAADEVHHRFDNSLREAQSTKRAVLTKMTTHGIRSAKLQKTRLGEIAAHWSVRTVEQVVSLCQYGLSIQLHEEGKYPIFRMMNYDDGKIVANDMKYVDLSGEDFDSFKVLDGDILFNRTNSADLVGKVGIFRLGGDFVFASYLVRLRARDRVILPDYLNYYLNSDLGQRRILAYGTPGVSQTNISAGNLKKVLVPVPPIEEQEEIVQILNSVDNSKKSIEEQLARSRHIQNDLINQSINPVPV